MMLLNREQKGTSVMLLIYTLYFLSNGNPDSMSSIKCSISKKTGKHGKANKLTADFLLPSQQNSPGILELHLVV